jgi:hypothetical protein
MEALLHHPPDRATSSGIASTRAGFLAIGRRWRGTMVELVRMAVELDESGEWALDGSVTCAHWIGDVLGVEVCTAREWLRVGRALGGLPLISAGFEAGEVSFSQARALIRHATPECERELLEIAARTRVGHLRRALAAWAARHEEDDARDRRQQDERSLRWSVEPDGMVRVSGLFTPQQFAFIAAGIDTAVLRLPRSNPKVTTKRGEDAFCTRRSRGEWLNGATLPTLAQQRSDALTAVMADVFSCGGRHETSSGTAPIVRRRVEVVAHVRGDGCTLDDGTPITESALSRLIPEADLRVMIHDAQRRPINASGIHRHHTTRQKRVVKERDRACIECGSGDFLEYDHEPSFEQSARTLVEETELRCSRCHRLRHRRARGESPPADRL